VAGKNTTPAVGTAWTTRDKRNRSILNNGRDKRETSGLLLRRGARVIGVVVLIAAVAVAALAVLVVVVVDGTEEVASAVSEVEEVVGAVVVSVGFAAGAEIAIDGGAHNTTSPAQA
jgi:hypothetical protein